MKEAMELVKNNRIYKDIFKEILKKYKKYGKITGSFTMKPKNHEDIQALLNFDSSVIYKGEARIKCSKVEELFNRKLQSASFIELMEAVVGEELLSNKEIKLQEKRELKSFIDNIVNITNHGIGKEWFTYSMKNKCSGYNSIIRKYNKNTNKMELSKELVLLINSLNVLPYLYGNKENIAVFAAKQTKDPHFFDTSKDTGNLLIEGIKYILKEDKVDTIDELNELYYEVGILKDEISNSTTVYGLEAFDKNNNEILPIKLYSDWKEPLQLSMSNLLKIDCMKAKNNTIFIFENPAVFHRISKVFDDSISIICTSGQLNLSSYMLLDKIRDLKNIYYAGDFDPEGLSIAYKLKLRYKSKVKFLLYDVEKYRKIKSDNIITDSRLKMLDKMQCKELEEIKNEILKNKKAAYQELLIDDYICKIKQISQLHIK